VALDDFLLPGEEVLARAGEFYATDRRLVRYSRTLWWQEMDEVSYAHLVSLPLITHRPYALAYLGLIVLLLGAGGMVVASLVGSILPDFRAGGTPFRLMLFLGIVLELLWFLLPSSYYQVRALGLGDKDAGRWRIGRVNSEQTRKLVAIVREHRPQG
jgi:hypothetical protein